MNKRIGVMTTTKDRRLFVIDIENALGTGILTGEMVNLAMSRLKRIHSIREEDFVVFGVSYDHNVFPVRTQEPHARIVYQQGINGADSALASVLANERIEERFTEVIIISGDNLFADEAMRLKKAGIRVTVTSRKATLSSKLAKSASRICYPGIKRQSSDRGKAA